MRARWVLVSVASLGALAIGLACAGTATATAAAATSGAPTVSCGSLDLTNQPVGTPVHASASLGAVSATLSGTATTSYQIPAIGTPTIRVRIGGASVLSAAVAVQDSPPGSSFVPGTFAGGGSPGPWSYVASGADRPLCVARFGGIAPETAVLVGIYSGGAHCCTLVDSYVLRAKKTSRTPIETNLGNPGVELVSIDRKAVLVTADNAFAYQFASFGGSGMPLMTLELRGNRYVDTTRDYPTWVSEDAGFQWGSYTQSGFGLGWLAAWAADECTLGRSSEVGGVLGALDTQGFLTGVVGWPSGAAYVSQLRSFLASTRYCRQ